jgi:predicted transcriptional regulator
MQIDRHIISENATLSEALRMLNDLSGGVMTLIAVNDGNRMTGTLTCAGLCFQASDLMLRWHLPCSAGFML